MSQEMINLGKAAKYLREEIGLSQRAAAEEIGISFVHLCRIEKEQASPSPEILEKYRVAWGIDVYMLAVCQFGEPGRFPPGMKAVVSSLQRAWTLEISKLI